MPYALPGMLATPPDSVDIDPITGQPVAPPAPDGYTPPPMAPVVIPEDQTPVQGYSPTAQLAPVARGYTPPTMALPAAPDVPAMVAQAPPEPPAVAVAPPPAPRPAPAVALPPPVVAQPAPNITSPLRDTARQIATAAGVDPNIFERLVTQESGWNPQARSPVGALGLTQLMPATAQALGVKNALDPLENLTGGAKYLKQQLDRYGGDYSKALAAYNAGPGNVDKYGGVPPFEETQRYVRNILSGGQPQGGTKFNVMSAVGGPPVPTFGDSSDVKATVVPPLPQPAAGNPPDVAPRTPSTNWPNVDVTGIIQQNQGGETSPGAFNPFDSTLLTPVVQAGINKAGEYGGAVLVKVGQAAQSALGKVQTGAETFERSPIGQNLEDHFRHTIAASIIRMFTAQTEEELQQAFDDGQRALMDAAMQLGTGDMEGGGAGAAGGAFNRAKQELTDAANQRAAELHTTPPAEPPPGETTSPAWARLNAEAQAGGKPPEPWQVTRSDWGRYEVWSNLGESRIPGEVTLKPEYVSQRTLDLEDAADAAARVRNKARVNQLTTDLLQSRRADFERAMNAHREAVAKAVAEGKPVPPEVLADYPDIQAGGKAPEPAPVPEAAPPAPEPTPVAAPAPEMRPRQTYQSIAESPLDTPVVRELLGADPYERLTNERVMTEARARVDANPTEALRNVLDESKHLDVYGVADAQILMQRAVNDGDVGAIKALAKRVAAEGTEAGRRVQIYSQIDQLSPEGTIVEFYRNLAEGTKKRGAAKTQRVVNETEAGLIRQKAAERIAAVDAIRAASQPAKTVQEAVTQGKGMAFNDFLKGMQDLLRQPGKGPRGAQMGALRAGPLVEIAPEDAARFYARAQEIQAITDPAQYAAEHAKLFADLKAYRADILKAARSEQRAAAAAERLKAAQAAREVAQRKREADKALTAFEREQAQTVAAPAQAEEKAAASLEKQKAAAPGRNAAALERQKTRETQAEALGRESFITYLSDREARAVKEQIKREMEADIRTAMKRRAKGNDIEVPNSIAQNLDQRARALRDMPTDTPRQKLDQLTAARQLMGDLSRFAPPDQWGKILDLWGLSRAMLTTMDNSYPLAQGGLLFLSNPVRGTRTLLNTTRAFLPGGEEVAKNIEAQFLYGQHSGAMKEAGLAFDDRFAVNKAGGSEFYPTNFAGKLPGVKQSERAFSTGGNMDRMNYWRRVVNSWLPDELKGRSFDTMKELAAATGRDERDFRELATWANVLTGKGKLPEFLKTSSPVLNMMFFAPRYFLSQLEVPMYAIKYGIGNSSLRWPIAKTMGGLAMNLGLTYGAIAYYASQHPEAGIKIQTDPLASGFGDIQVGNHHINLLMGYGPLIHNIAMVAAGKEHANNKEYEKNQWEALTNWFMTKLVPPIQEARDILGTGVDAQGNPTTTPSPRDPAEASLARFLGQDPTTRSGWENMLRRLSKDYLPMFGTDVMDWIAHNGTLGDAITQPAKWYGLRDNVYQTTAALQNQTAQRLGLGTDYKALKATDKALVDAEPEVQAAYDQQDARNALGITDRAQVAVTLRNYQTRNTGIENGYTEPTSGQFHPGLKQKVQALSGKALADAIKDAKDARYQNAATSFNQYYEAAKGKTLTEEARDVLRQAYWSAGPDEDPQTGELDFAAQDARRASILRQAADQGIDPDYITSKVSPWQDPVVRAKVDEYERDMQTLRKYYDLGDNLQAQTPAFAAAVAEHDRLAASGNADALRRFELTTSNWIRYRRDLEVQRTKMRQSDKAVEAAGEKWLGWRPTRGASPFGSIDAGSLNLGSIDMGSLNLGTLPQETMGGVR